MTMSRYSEYRWSGVDWLGDVPAHWGVVPLKRIFEVSLGKMLQNEASSESDEAKPYLRAANIKWSGVDTSDIKLMWISSRERSHLRLRVGDLLVSEGGDVGRSCVWQAELPECYFQNSVNRVRSRGEGDTKYLYYWMSAIKSKGFIDVICNKSTIAHFTAEKVAEVPTPFPPLQEQLAIAAFLDRETAVIDALIAEQERLLALLAEKRQAVISHAVTKGLDPDAPMKDSEVAWLGRVPAHWAVVPLKRCLSDIKAGPFGSALTKDMYVDSGYRVYGQEQVIPADFSVGDYYVDEQVFRELRQYQVTPGDVLISCVGTFGKVAVVPADIEAGVINPRLLRLRCAQAVSPDYLVELLRSSSVFEQISSASRGGTMDIINAGTLGKVWVALPPPEEQADIIQFVRAELQRIEALTDASRRAASLIRERRVALIAAAATGKIDVREVA